MAIQPETSIWLDGAIVPWDQANTHVLTHTLHYGLGAFEGLRCYSQSNGQGAVFRLQDHLLRLFRSCKLCRIQVPFSLEQLTQACIEVLRHNRLNEAYMRPLIFLGSESLGIGDMNMTVHAMVAAWTWRAYIREAGTKEGIRTKISSFTRGGLNSTLAKGKICGQYVNSVLAKREVMVAGYDEAILLDERGYVTEGSSENLFLVQQGRLITPPLSSAILEGVTRDSVMTIARDLSLPTTEAFVTRDQLYVADEIFLTGTAAEITPVKEVDNIPIGNGQPGPITKQLQAAFSAAVRGQDKRYASWLRELT